MELIDKAAVVTEIERRIKERDIQMKSGCWVSSTYIYEDLLDFLEKQGEKIDTIENFDTEFEKQVSCLIASVINREYEYNQGYVKWTANALLEYAKHELEKQGEQKPAEWSDEDERLFQIVIDILDRENHWKPSEEQMDYLKKVYESYYFCDGERSALESLYNDLKKL